MATIVDDDEIIVASAAPVYLSQQLVCVGSDVESL